MGYGYMTYTVDLDALTAVAGSGNDTLRRQISGRFRRDIFSTNDQLGWSNDRGADNVFEALRDIIMGDPMDIAARATYGYAYKYIVEHLGRSLNNADFYPCPMSYAMDTIDPALEAAGVPVRVAELSYSSAPFTFPSPDDFPGYGYWSTEDVARSHAIFAEAGPQSDPHVEAVRDWCATAQATGRAIVGFYH